MPMSSDTPGSVSCSVSPVSRAARSDRAWISSTRGLGRGGPGMIRRRSSRYREPRASGAGWCCRYPNEGLGVAPGEPASRCGMTVIWSSPPITARMPRIAGSAKAALRSAARASAVAPSCASSGTRRGSDQSGGRAGASPARAQQEKHLPPRTTARARRYGHRAAPWEGGQGHAPYAASKHITSTRTSDFSPLSDRRRVCHGKVTDELSCPALRPGLPGQITIISQDGGWRLLQRR